MKKYLIVLIVMLSIFSVGCDSKDKELKELLNQGKTALESDKYEEAIDYLSDYLHDMPKDEEARSMYKQAVNMKKALAYKDKEYYSESLEYLDEIVNLKTGSKDVKVDANNLKKEIEKLKEEAEMEEALRKEEAKKVAKQAIKKSEEDYYIWKQNETRYDDDSEEETSIIDDVTNFIGNILQ